MWTSTLHSNRKTSSFTGLLALTLLCLSTWSARSQGTFTGQWLLEVNPEPMPMLLTLRYQSVRRRRKA